jgi:hypothetical protein
VNGFELLEQPPQLRDYNAADTLDAAPQFVKFRSTATPSDVIF